jgi:hypothetical protein
VKNPPNGQRRRAKKRGGAAASDCHNEEFSRWHPITLKEWLWLVEEVRFHHTEDSSIAFFGNPMGLFGVSMSSCTPTNMSRKRYMTTGNHANRCLKGGLLAKRPASTIKISFASNMRSILFYGTMYQSFIKKGAQNE